MENYPVFNKLSAEMRLAILADAIKSATDTSVDLLHEEKRYKDVIPTIRFIDILSSVCRDWRSLIHETSSLWTTVIVPLVDIDAVRNVNTLLLKVSRHLQLSKSLPLDVHIALFIWAPRPTQRLVHPIIDQSNRWKNVFIISDSPTSFGLWRQIRAPSVSPQLCHLSLNIDVMNSWISLDAPPLRSCTSLSLTANIFAPQAWQDDEPYTNIKNLEIRLQYDTSFLEAQEMELAQMQAENSLAVAWELIALCPTTEKLRLAVPHHSPERRTVPTEEEVKDTKGGHFHMNHLKEAIITGCLCRDGYSMQFYLRRLIAPHLRKFSVEHPIPPYIVDFLRQSKCSLDELEFTISPSMTTSLWRHFAPLIHSVTVLTIHSCGRLDTTDVVLLLQDPLLVPNLRELSVLPCHDADQLTEVDFAWSLCQARAFVEVLENRKGIVLRCTASLRTDPNIDLVLQLADRINECGLEGEVSFYSPLGDHWYTDADSGKVFIYEAEDTSDDE